MANTGDVHDIAINPPNLIFCRTNQFMTIYDIRNIHRPLLQYNLNPKVNIEYSHHVTNYTQVETYAPTLAQTEHEIHFNVTISRDKKYWATGFYGSQVQVGNLTNDILSFKATRLLKKSRDKDTPGWQIGAKLLMARGQVNPARYSDITQGYVEKTAFAEDCLFATAGGNVFIYGWW